MSARRTIRTSGLCAALVGLAACGGGGGGLALPPPAMANPPPGVDALALLYEEATDRLAARSNTAFIDPIEGIPATGSADFVGIVYVLSATPGENTELYGQAAITADFAGRAMSGTAIDFWGTDRTGSEAPYTGTLALTNGTIGTPVPNDFTLDYGGALTGNGETISLAGTIDGKFKADPMRGLLGADLTPSLLIDGDPFTSQVGLAAEIVPN